MNMLKNKNDTSSFQNLLEILQKEYPQFATLWNQSRRQFGEVWEREISRNISCVFGDALSEKWTEALDGYAQFCIDAMRAQIFFEKNGKYAQKDYDDVVKDCYHSSDYMEKRYLPGQYLSHYIWPHHQRMLRRFVHELLPKVAGDVSLFYEVGVGCGMYSQKTLETLPRAKGIGVDISDYSLRFTQRVVRSHGLGDRYEIRNQNILTEPLSQSCDFIISQEVLEHLSDPQTFVKALYHATRAGGWGYISAAINAGHTDHIYLYRSPREVQDQIESVGWKVHDIQIESNYPEKAETLRPTIAGYLVKK